MTVIGRVFLLFQLVTVYPLISYMLRVQTMITLAGIPYPSRLHVIAFNAIMVIICVLFAIFLPKIGTIIRYVIYELSTSYNVVFCFLAVPFLCEKLLLLLKTSEL